ncbi:hypothetical protein ACWGK5_25680 [Rhodococcus qingshengii]
MSTLIETLAAHQLEIIDGTCTCGDWGYGDVPEDASDPDLGEMHAAHVAAVIAETHAIVELPKQVDGWWPGGNSEIHIDGSDVVQVSFGRSIYRSTRMTRTLAAGLLAAANAIEVSS